MRFKIPAMRWPRSDVIAVIGVVLTAIGSLAAVIAVPELHDRIFGPAPSQDHSPAPPPQADAVKCPEPTRQIATLREAAEPVVEGMITGDTGKNQPSPTVNLWAAYPRADLIAIYQDLLSISCHLVGESNLPDDKKVDKWTEIMTVLGRGLKPEEKSEAGSSIRDVFSVAGIESFGTPDGRFLKVDIAGIANFPLDWLVKPPQGVLLFDGIPFDILGGNRAVIHTRNHDRPDLPVAVSIPVGLASIRAVHLLLNGNWTFPNEVVGMVRISYTEGPAQEIPLKGMQTIRETWMPTADVFNTHISPPPLGVTWNLVYSERQSRGWTPATGLLDRLSIETDPHREIDEIAIFGSSWQAGSGVIVTAVTLQKSGRGRGAAGG